MKVGELKETELKQGPLSRCSVGLDPTEVRLGRGIFSRREDGCMEKRERRLVKVWNRGLTCYKGGEVDVVTD